MKIGLNFNNSLVRIGCFNLTILALNSQITNAWEVDEQSTYTDVTYVVTGSFSVKGTTLGIGDQIFGNLSFKKNNPEWGKDGGVGNKSPFDNQFADGHSRFSQGYVRIRYMNRNKQCGFPMQTNGGIVSWFFPLEFKQTKGATVNVNVDHSAALLDSSLTNCGGGDPECRNHTPALISNFTTLNSGYFEGTTLKWDNCLPAPSGDNAWNFAKARLATGGGCVKYTAFGNINSTSSMVPSSGRGDYYQSWNQKFNSFVFNGTDLLTATFTMAQMQIPNGTGQSNTWLEITSSSVLASSCTVN